LKKETQLEHESTRKATGEPPGNRGS
jgi:hypothetical protein